MIKLNNNIIPVWKPVDTFSNEIVYKLRDKHSLKIGHAGTLDPFAEGVLLLCTGNKTKEIDKLHSFSKRYVAEIKLGLMTDTLDRDGTVILKRPVKIKNRKVIEKKLNRFKRGYMQSPPAFSAIRKNNVRLYSLARQDIFLRLKPREVFIESIELVNLKKDTLIIDLICRSGTYIRSLARDIAEDLGTCGYLKSLKRESIGKYQKADCYSSNQLLNESL